MSELQVKLGSPQKFGAAGVFATDFFLELEIGTPTDRVLDPDYWRLIAKRPDIAPGAIIRVISESPPTFQELLVRSVNRFASVITVERLRLVELSDPHASAIDDGLPAEHVIKFLGPASKWSLLRGDQVLGSGYATRADALAFAKSALRSQAS